MSPFLGQSSYQSRDPEEQRALDREKVTRNRELRGETPDPVAVERAVNARQAKREERKTGMIAVGAFGAVAAGLALATGGGFAVAGAAVFSVYKAGKMLARLNSSDDTTAGDVIETAIDIALPHAGKLIPGG